MVDANVIVDSDRQFVAESSPTEQSDIVENLDKSDHKEGSSPVKKSKRICRYQQEWNAYDAPSDPLVGWEGGHPFPFPTHSSASRSLAFTA